MDRDLLTKNIVATVKLARLFAVPIVHSTVNVTSGGPAVPIVAVYPTEGTFWSDHPSCILDAEWVKPAEREAAENLIVGLRSAGVLK